MRLHQLVFFVVIFYDVALCGKRKTPVTYSQDPPGPKYDNPNFIKDRHREISKPQMPSAWNDRNTEPFHPAWMDYCDPYHCNDYHKPACGLNRKRMEFRWFQSQCHIVLNNKCAYSRGLTKYDVVDVRYCYAYVVMPVRSGCPRLCGGEVDAVCGVNRENKPQLFKNSCALEMANCNNTADRYQEVRMKVCDEHFATP